MMCMVHRKALHLCCKSQWMYQYVAQRQVLACRSCVGGCSTRRHCVRSALCLERMPIRVASTPTVCCRRAGSTCCPRLMHPAMMGRYVHATAKWSFAAGLMTVLRRSSMHTRAGDWTTSRLHRCRSMAANTLVTARVPPALRSGSPVIRCSAGQPKASGRSSESSGQAAVPDKLPSMTAVRRMPKVRRTTYRRAG